MKEKKSVKLILTRMGLGAEGQQTKKRRLLPNAVFWRLESQGQLCQREVGILFVRFHSGPTGKLLLSDLQRDDTEGKENIRGTCKGISSSSLTSSNLVSN